MLTLVDLRGYTGDPLERLPRAVVDRDAARASVRTLVADVRTRGDEAVREASKRFGGSRAEPRRIPAADVSAAAARCEAALLDALRAAADRIRAYHEAQLAEERAAWWRIGPDSMRVGEETRPLRRVGCYVPGGRAAYPSTALMTVLPAILAGVEQVVACVPGAPDGSGINPATLAALEIAGASEVHECGGAQAIAAMAYGTETIGRVDKIVGPGSIWVALAKHEVALDVGVDSFAGPTEVAIVADASAPASFVAADLLAQAEHDPLATPLLITWDVDYANAVDEALEAELGRADRREDVEAALKAQGRAVLVDDLDHALAVADAFAPEHLELCLADAELALQKIRNAGAVFVGPYSPVALGDYVAGTNHVLPTAGTARFASPLRVADFIKSTAVIQFDRAGVEAVAPALLAIAKAEGLTAHARAVEVRLS
ncbi:MAG: histidinol dehydrogenase [Actinomycetota bacterium]